MNDALRVAMRGLLLGTLFGAQLAAAQAPGEPGNPGTASLKPPPDAPPIKPTPPGPYAVTIEANPGLPTHTIYRPEDLKPFTGKKRLPIVAWGNGACSNAGLLFETFLRQVASHGYMIVVSGPKDAPLPAFARGGQGQGTAQGTASPEAPAAPPAPASVPAAAAPSGLPPGLPPPMTHDQDLKTGIDWAIAENEHRGSAYYHRLNPDKVAVMGQSCGGLQAIVESADPRIKTSIIWNSGVFPDGSRIGRSISGATKASLKDFHAPVAYINGGPADAAYVNTIDDIKHIDKVPVFFGWINVGHGGTYSHPGGGRFAVVGVAWLDWQLNGDKRAGKLFVGADCGLCKDPIWHVEKKNMQ